MINEYMENISLKKYDHINTAVYNLITPHSSVLDVGCWNGALGYALIKNKNCVVDGVEKNKDASSEAKEKGYNEVYTLDLNNLDTLRIKDKQYDFIIFADVLEHILYPEQVLEFFSHYVKNNGSVIVSLPNIAFFTCRIRLLFGKFEYKELGIIDKTHVKFYTLKTTEDLFRAVRLKLIKTIPHNELAKKYFVFQGLKYLAPKLFTRQFVFLLRAIKNRQ